ncbi:hypothetical protein [Flintibacter muris]|uniref:hypothetical protein n=1 Tax=Flintibacter muris TaxID=2941327 RepID=UPI00203BDED1|nr:hypothetical protein [Flintibacter muris]
MPGRPADELRALSLEDDDYITKSYNILVLLARIKAVLRRAGRASHFKEEFFMSSNQFS